MIADRTDPNATITAAIDRLDRAVTNVAQAAREVADSAEPLGSRHSSEKRYAVDAETLAELKEALAEWTEASNGLGAAIRANPIRPLVIDLRGAGQAAMAHGPEDTATAESGARAGDTETR